MMLAPHSARHVETRRAEWARRSWSAQQPQLRRPSQQRFRRSSVAAALRAASAPSQQHQLRRGRDPQNERDGAGLSSDSVAAATPSQLRRSSAAGCAHHERSTGHWAEQPLGKICHVLTKNRGTLPSWSSDKPCFFNI